VVLAGTLAFNMFFRKALYLVVGPHIPDAHQVDLGMFTTLTLPSQLPVFSLGIVMFHVFQRLRTSETSRSKANLRATYLGLFLALVFLLVSSSLEKVLPADARVGAVFLFFGLLLAQTNYRVFVNRATILLGRISFSVYLSHFIALQLVLWASRAWYEPHFHFRPHFGFAFPCVLAIASVISTITYRFVEIPGQRLGRGLIQRLEGNPSRLAPAESPLARASRGSG
jgi:peptidoglycan/LPS O-acetylase OafA/YrhL